MESKKINFHEKFSEFFAHSMEEKKTWQLAFMEILRIRHDDN